ALGQLVDQLAEAAEINQELHTDDIDHREDQAQPQTDEDRWQGRRQQDLAKLLRRREPEASTDVDQHLPRPREALQRLEYHRREPGGEADHDDCRRAATEYHQEQRIHQDNRRRRERGDPGLARGAQQPEAVEQGTERYPGQREQQARPQELLHRLREAVQHVFLGDDARQRADDLRRQRHDKAIDDADPDKNLDQRDHADRRRQADGPRTEPRRQSGTPARLPHFAHFP